MKRILLPLVLLLASQLIYAAPVDVTTATTTAQQFAHLMAKNGRHKATSSSNTTLVHTELSATYSNQAVYYIFNTGDSYVIVAGDDRSTEVLAYGDQPIEMTNIPEAMRFWLDSYKEQVECLLARPDMVAEKGAQRFPERVNESVQPLLTARWDQDEPYNNQCPISNGSHCVTGCPATSLAMVFYYWKYPTEQTPSVSGYVSQSLNLNIAFLPPISFDWDNMLDRYNGDYTEDQANAVAWLMRYIGQAERMDYGLGSSGSYGFNILQTIRFFGYDQEAEILFKSSWWGDEENYTNEEWGEIMQNELYSHRPMVMCAYANGGVGGLSGHAFNIDGYDGENDMYHINWGWSGSGNGYFAMNAFRGSGMTFNIDQQLIIGIEPPVTSPTIKCNKSKLHLTSLAEKSVIESFIVKPRMLTSDVTLTLNDNTGCFALDADQVQADYQNGQEIHVTYSPKEPGTHQATITLSSNGAEDVVITLNGTAILETYTPEITDVNSLSPKSFMIKWKDNTPAKNVDSYQLEIVKLPFSELRLHEIFNKNTTTGTSTSDCSSRLDEYTQSPGWTGSKVYLGNGYFRIGGSTSVGWLETPPTDMRNNNGTVTVKVIAKCAGTEVSGALKISCGDNDTTVLVTNDQREICVLLPCASNKNATVRLSGKRILIYGESLLAGDDYSPIDLNSAEYRGGITGTSCEIKDVEPGNYSLRLKAIYTDGSESMWSNYMRVLLDWPIGDVNRDGEVGIADINTLINVVLGNTIDSQLYSISDLNDDGEVSIADINILINIILNAN